MRVFERRDLNVNVGKSKVLRFNLNGEQEPLRMRLGSKEIEEVSESKYLEPFLSVDGGMEEELNTMGVLADTIVYKQRNNN